MFAGRSGDGRHTFGNIRHRIHDGRQCVSGPVHQIDTLTHLISRGRDQRIDFTRRLGRTLRQRAHLGGHHRESAPRVPCPRGFDTGVQGQQVGLKGDVVDHAGDFGNLLARGLDLVHGAYGFAGDIPTLLGILLGIRGHLAGRIGAFSRRHDRACQLVQRRRRLFECRGLFFSPS